MWALVVVHDHRPAALAWLNRVSGSAAARTPPAAVPIRPPNSLGRIAGWAVSERSSVSSEESMIYVVAMVRVDGSVAGGLASLDESAVTGEAGPVSYPPGSPVMSGPTNAG